MENKDSRQNFDAGGRPFCLFACSTFTSPPPQDIPTARGQPPRYRAKDRCGGMPIIRQGSTKAMLQCRKDSLQGKCPIFRPFTSPNKFPPFIFKLRHAQPLRAGLPPLSPLVFRLASADVLPPTTATVVSRTLVVSARWRLTPPQGTPLALAVSTVVGRSLPAAVSI